MATIQCKMCGASFPITDHASTCECDHCGTLQTLPKLQSDRKTSLCARANQLRRSNEFDKAIAMYEDILKEDPTDPEIYWSMVLCRYGVEYVKDPVSGKQIPTVNRTQITPIFNDADYRSALDHADSQQKSLYQSEAKAINEIQKQILAISENEDPFDVFICFKASDNGQRTRDSVIGNQLYHELVEAGFKVFFSPITLAEKMGSEYEPYIFAALNSAKVMVVLGTKPEYFQAPWVRNEWSRFLAMIHKGEKKKLIPAYRDMDPYDMPEEFANLQALDMGDIAFMPHLIRGIKAILEHTTAPKRKAAPAPEAPIYTPPVAAPASTTGAGSQSYPYSNIQKFAEVYVNLGPQGVYTDQKGQEVFVGKQYSALENALQTANYYNVNGDLEGNVLKPIYSKALYGYGDENDPRKSLNSMRLMQLIGGRYRPAAKFLQDHNDELKLHKQLSNMTAFEIQKEKDGYEVDMDMADEYPDEDFVPGLLPVYEAWLALKQRLAYHDAASREAEAKAKAEWEAAEAARRAQLAADAEASRKSKKRVKRFIVWFLIVFFGYGAWMFITTYTDLLDNLFSNVSLPGITDSSTPSESTVNTATHNGLLYEKQGESYVLMGFDPQNPNTDSVITIPSEIGGIAVIGIAESAFDHNSTIQQLILSEGITYIGKEAFTYCTSLQSVSLPSSLTKIGWSAFNECSSLQTIAYAGTVNEWKLRVTLESYWSFGAPADNVTCSDGETPRR